MSKISNVEVRGHLHQFWRNRGGFPDSGGAWCAECYTPHPLDNAEVDIPQDFEGESLEVPEDKARFVRARGGGGGDHILCSFQCA